MGLIARSPTVFLGLSTRSLSASTHFSVPTVTIFRRHRIEYDRLLVRQERQSLPLRQPSPQGYRFPEQRRTSISRAKERRPCYRSFTLSRKVRRTEQRPVTLMLGLLLSYAGHGLSRQLISGATTEVPQYLSRYGRS